MATAFQESVWALLRTIPRGRVTTYQAIASKLGKPGAVRAVGTACGSNPELVDTPCHRVVKSSGEIGMYARGVDKKIALLQSEGVGVDNNKIIDFEHRCFNFD